MIVFYAGIGVLDDHAAYFCGDVHHDRELGRPPTAVLLAGMPHGASSFQLGENQIQFRREAAMVFIRVAVIAHNVHSA